MYDKDILREILLEIDCRAIDDTGLPYKPAHNVYAIISQRMNDRGSKITPKHAYCILKEDRNGFRSIVQKAYNLPNKTAEIPKTDNSSLSTDMSLGNLTNTFDMMYSKKIKIIVSSEKYQLMKPVQKLYSGRIFWKFREGWTDIIAERIWQQHKIDCVISFKNNIVHPSANAKAYAKFDGKCLECQSTIHGILRNEPAKNVDVVFEVEIQNIVPNHHSGDKKRQLRGDRREKIATRLIEQRKAAVTYRYEEAKRLKKFGDKDPPILPSREVLRKAKEQQLLKIHGLCFGNPALNLYHHSKNGKHAGTIHKIGLEKFYCIYWTPEQQQIYTERCKKNVDTIFTIDATGGIAKREGMHDPAIFLYQCMVITNKGSVPVFQMISADQTALAIGYFLWYILTKGAPIPSIVVTDFGWALLIAVAKVFGMCHDLQDYLQRCYGVAVLLQGTLPKTYLRLDVSHLVHMVTRWKCLHGKGPAVRNFYKRCVAQAYQMSDLRILADFLEAILVVSLSEFIGYSDNNEAVPAETRIQLINDVIRGTYLSDEEDHYDGLANEDCQEKKDQDRDDGDDDSQNDHASDTDWKMWADTIHRAAQNLAEKSKGGSIINGCYNPEFAKQFKKQLMPYASLWTGIMRPHFKRGLIIATSSAVEAEFGDMKRSLKGILPTRPDKFVLQHIDDHLDGKVKLSSNEGDRKTISDQNRGESKKKSDLPAAEIYSSASEFEESDFSKNKNNGTDVPSEIEGSHVISDQQLFNHSVTAGSDIKAIESTNSLVGNTSSFTIDEDRQTSTPVEFKQWNINENWRNKAEKINTDKITDEEPIPKKRYKQTCLDKCPEWDYIKDIRNPQLPMFQNGLLKGCMTIKKKSISVVRTCPFDSIFQVILSGIACHKSYHDAISSSSSPLIQLALSVLKEKKINAKHYVERANILWELNLFEDAKILFTRTITRLDAHCNVSHLADYLFAQQPSCTKNSSCTCGYQNSHPCVTISVNVDILLNDGFHLMQEAIDDALVTRRTCIKCKNILNDQVVYSPHILLDLSVITDEHYEARNKTISHRLETITPTISLGGDVYALAGLAHYEYEHYTAYTKTGLYWYMYNDMRRKRESVQKSTIIKPHLFVYVLSKKG